MKKEKPPKKSLCWSCRGSKGRYITNRKTKQEVFEKCLVCKGEGVLVT